MLDEGDISRIRHGLKVRNATPDEMEFWLEEFCNDYESKNKCIKELEDENKRLKRQLREGYHCQSFGMCGDEHEVLVNRIKELEELLKIAKCPNCDGSGCIPHKVSERQYVTRDMALDACDESLEGSLYSDEQWEAEQCQWCFEKDQVLKENEQ